MRLLKVSGNRLPFAGGLFVATLVLTALFGVFHAPKTYAVPAPTSSDQIQAGTYTFIDRATIQGTINGQTYIFMDQDIGDNGSGQFNYKILNNDCTGGSGITFLPPPGQANNPNLRLEDFIEANEAGSGMFGTIQIKINQGGVTSCGPSTPENIRIGVNPQGIGIWYVQRDENTIVRADGNAGEVYALLPNSNGSVFMRTSESNCKDVILKNTSNNQIALYRLDRNQGQPIDQVFPDAGTRAVINQPDCRAQNAANRDSEQLPATMTLGTQVNNPNAGNAGNDNGEDNTPTCENSSPWSLNWIVCPLIEGIQAALDTLINNIDSLLEFDASYYNNATLKASWSNVNRYATVALVAAGLIMVISTALGFSFVDAYTLRKILPRLLIAAVAMQLSWYLMQFFIIAINDIGKGIADLMYAPFGGAEKVSLLKAFQASGAAGNGDPAANGLFLGATLAGIGIAGMAIIFSFATTALGIVIIAFLILILRRLILVALIVMAPIAIVSSILPNTDGFWKFWRFSFVNLMIMYPLVMMLIAGGRIFAQIASGVPDNPDSGIIGGVLQDFTKIGAIAIGYFGVLAGIPWLASRIGGLVGNVTGVVNNRSKGYFDKRRKARQEGFAKRKELAGSNQLYGASSPFRKLNDAASWVASPIGNTRYMMGKAAHSGEEGVPKTRAQKMLARLGGSVYSDVDSKIGDHTDKLAQHLLARGVVIDKAHLALSGAFDDKPPEDGDDPSEGYELKRALIGKGIMTESEYRDYRKNGVTNDATLAKVRQGLMAVDNAEYTERFRDAAAQLGNVQGEIGEWHSSSDYGKGNLKAASAYVAASQGFMDNDQIMQVANDLRGAGMSRHAATIWAGKTSAAAFGKGVLEAKATYGVRQRADGEFYNAMSGGEFEKALKTMDTADSNSAEYKEAQALVNNQVQLVTSLKNTDWSTIKGHNRIKNMKPVIEYILKGNTEGGSGDADLANQMRSNLDYMTNYGNADVKSRGKIRQILDNTPTMANYQPPDQNRSRRAANAAGPHVAEEPPPEAGGGSPG